jgi:hypothetical protein
MVTLTGGGAVAAPSPLLLQAAVKKQSGKSQYIL